MMLFSFCPVFIFGQVKTDFETGFTGGWEQFPENRWGISDENPISGFYSLRHSFDNSGSGCDHISLNYGELLVDSSIYWSFKLFYDYKPSGSNNWAVYLLSEENAELFHSDANALILGVNLNSTDDSLKFHFQDGKNAEVEKVLELNWEDDVKQEPVLFEIFKNREELFSIQIKRISGETIFSEGGFKLKLPENPEYFGLAYCYTSSKDMLLSLDDLEINASFYRDTLPPEIEEVKIHSGRRIEFIFSEKIFLKPDLEFRLSNDIEMDSFQINQNSVLLFSPRDLENDLTYSYLLKGIEDKKGNSTILTGEFLFFYPGFKSIIFTEIFPDPSPKVYLPENEYLEMYNRWHHPVNLQAWKLKIGEKEILFPELEIKPEEYILLGSAEPEHYQAKHYIRLFSSSTLLKNSGSLITLEDPYGLLIDALEYHQNWYADEMKSEGGWSLERIDPENLCGKEENWKASIDPAGGTPGKENSVKDVVFDHINPFGKRLIYSDSLVWIYSLNESLINGKDWKEYRPPEEILSMEFIPPLNDGISFALNDKSVLPYNFKLPSLLEDCASNRNINGDSLVFAIPEKPGYLDIIITEIMMEPIATAPEFIEIFNRSQKVISLDNLALEVRTDENDDRNYNLLCNEKILFYPGDYLVLSPDIHRMLEFHYPISEKLVLEVENWKALPDSEGRIRLMDRSADLIDETDYSQKQHFPVLNNTSGVSLERIFNDFQPGSQSEWHSASSLSGYSTPGYQNSQLIRDTEKTKSFYIETEVISPDNDGIDDMAIFSYRFEREGYYGTLSVYDYSGRIIRNLYSNILLGTTGELVWDGRNNAGSICGTGAYIVFFETIHLSGIRKDFKETVVLVRTMN